MTDQTKSLPLGVENTGSYAPFDPHVPNRNAFASPIMLGIDVPVTEAAHQAERIVRVFDD